ncbi:MAG: hypothetical protein LBU20_00725 [Candidatus Nomurabacteria bacterium]|nr:hypothetical protein [Candidatus Nomurabacteria bacterium]
MLLAAFQKDSDDWDTGFFAEYGKGFIPLAVFLVGYIVIGFFISSPMLHASAYAQRISISQVTEFKESDLPVFDPEQLPWVSEEQAQVLGDKKLGELGSIGSSTHMGEYVRQEVNGELFYVSPILWDGFFEYNSDPSGTPGYVMVSMTNDSDVRLIDELDGQPIKLRYQPRAAWGDKLARHTRDAYPTLAIAEWKFEVDEELRPYWVGSYIEKTIGLAAPDVRGALIVDAQTGEIGKYGLEEIPDWVDRIQPTSYIEDQINWWGHYSGGFWNTWFGKSNLTELTAGNTMVFKDGDCYLFSGLTAAGGTDASTVGFVLTDYRTKETVYYHRTGATEEAAMTSAMGDDRVRPSGYVAEFPIPVMIEGQPTYFFGLRDPDSNVNKAFGLVNIEQHQIVGIGSTINGAKTDYLTRLRSYKGGALSTPTVGLVDVEGVVLRIGSYADGGNTFYKFVVDSAADKILLADTSLAEISITKEGDKVKVRVVKTDESTWSVFSFDNLEFTQELSELEEAVSQTEVEQKLDEIAEDPNVASGEEFKEWFNELTPEQQDEFLKSLEG